MSRSTVETALLALALIAIGGFIGYKVWPPSAAYLYKQAGALMASSRHADWVTAREEYIKPLDEGFPDHPYREQTRKWRDKILLDDAESRAKILTSGLKIRMSEPSNNTERQLVITHELAEGASGRRDDLTAMRQWQDFAKQLTPDDPDERKWYLFALHQVERLENIIKDRRESVEKKWELAERPRAGRPEEAVEIKTKLIEQYSGFTDLADIFPAAPVASGPDQKAAESPDAPAPPPSATVRPKKPRRRRQPTRRQRRIARRQTPAPRQTSSAKDPPPES